MWKLWQKPKLNDAEAIRTRLNQIEIDVQQLQLESAERHIAVLNAVEKVMHQLRARTRRRDTEKPSEDDVQETIDREALPYHPRVRKMRGF